MFNSVYLCLKVPVSAPLCYLTVVILNLCEVNCLCLSFYSTVNFLSKLINQFMLILTKICIGCARKIVPKV